MKLRILLTSFYGLLGMALFAQSPSSFNYQAIVRNAAGQPLAGQSVSAKFSILDQNGNTLFAETHSANSNSLGLIVLNIGKGTPEAPFTSLETIGWVDGNPQKLKVEIDPQGGTNYTLTSESPLESVPFALYSDAAGTAKSLQGVPISPSLPDTGNVLKWDGSQWAPAREDTAAQSSWTISGNDIYANNIGYVGVGTNTPLAPLHIKNPLSATEALRIQGSNTWLGFWDGALYDGFLWNNSGSIGLGTSHLNPGGSLRLYTYGSERMRILASGLIGIGTTNPLYSLHVEGSGVAIYGKSTNSYGLYGYSNGQIGIYGYSNALGSAGIFGQSAYIGVEGITNAGSTDGSRQGVRGDNHGSSTGWAGYFYGNVGVSGSLSKGAGSFKIDHPLDPENKFLYHSFVESPDMKNIYDGIVTTDAQGLAEVVLPDWFEALNMDFRYQLTVIGTFAQAIVEQKMQGNRFWIKTNQPHIEVSWQLTGIRKDPYAEQHRIPVEENKPADKIGKYLHPDVYGKSKEEAIDYNPVRTIHE